MIFGTVKLNLVAGNAFSGYFLITSSFMTVYTCDIMSASERERSMIKIGNGPAIGNYIMAFQTIGRIAI
jgi:hypothetical protein